MQDSPDFWHLFLGAIGGVARQCHRLMTATVKDKLNWRRELLLFVCGGGTAAFTGFVVGDIAGHKFPEYANALAGMGGFIGPSILFFTWEIIQMMARQRAKETDQI